MENLPNASVAAVLVAASAVSSCLLGVLVLWRNPHRLTHRLFFLMSLNLALWSTGVFVIIHCHTQEQALFWLRLTFAIASFLPATFYHFIVFFPYQRFHGVRAVLYLLYGGAVLSVIGVNTPWYVGKVATFPDSPPLVVHYGPVFVAYGGLIVIALLFSVTNLLRKLQHTRGIERRQIQHVLVSLGAAAFLGSATNVLAPVLQIGTLEHYGPCFVVLTMGGLAYSMMRYHLLDIWVLVSRTTVYALLTGFVVATFLGMISLVHLIFSSGERTGNIVTTALAALVIALVLEPLKERIQLFFDRMVLQRRYDANALIERISRYAVRSVQMDGLLKRVVQELQNTMGVNAVRVLLVSEQEPDVLVTEFSTVSGEPKVCDINLDFLRSYIEEHDQPILLEELLHRRPTPIRVRLAQHLAEMDAFLLAPLKTTSGVIGMICLGEKRTHDIYTREDYHVMSTLAGPLATSIENARLYRKLEGLNLHLERIMTNMRGGVVAVDSKGTITTLNEEARDMLGIAGPGRDLSELPAKVAELLRLTLDKQRGISDVETVIGGPDNENMPVAMSSSCFSTTAKDTLGAMVLIYNMTRIKHLESNVQRADRLTSIGTMAAGMAHEIKNPLQSIKTFTQLLLSRFEDADFRKTYCEVVPPEVQRIDTIVSRLLDFARPKPVHFEPREMPPIIGDVLALVENQTRKAGVTVTTEFPEEIKYVTADDQQLHQVFLNLVLNAIEALKDGEERRLTIKMHYQRAHLARKGQPLALDEPCVKVVVSDTGCGIPKESMRELFTPFFTTKADGCGLGLSVVHGIVTEHGGTIDVSSKPGVGTSFSLTFPLAGEREAAERISA